MQSASKDIADLLNGESSLGLTLGTDLFYSRMPPTQDNLVCVFDNPGAPPLKALQKSAAAYYYSSINVQVRNTDYDSGYDQIMDIMVFLHNHSNETLNGTLYCAILAENDPQLLHRDENDRCVFVVNFEIQRKNA